MPRPCVTGSGTVIHPCASIINNLGRRDAVTIGDHTHIKGELLTFAHGGRITIGSYCFVGEHSRLWSAVSLSVGDRVLISHNVNIFDSDTHPLDPSARHEQFKAIIKSGHPANIDLREKPVVISDDVLIGCMSIVLAGVTIGEAAVVGAGSVVTKDVPPWTVVAGNPARIIKEIPRGEK